MRQFLKSILHEYINNSANKSLKLKNVNVNITNAIRIVNVTEIKIIR